MLSQSVSNSKGSVGGGHRILLVWYKLMLVMKVVTLHWLTLLLLVNFDIEQVNNGLLVTCDIPCYDSSMHWSESFVVTSITIEHGFSVS